MTTNNKQEFTKIWEKEFDIKEEGLKRIVKITTVDKEDYKGKEEGQYGTEEIYEFEMGTNKGKEKSELRINKSKKALGKIKVGDKDYVIWTFVNEDGPANLFKLDDEYWVRVEEKINVKGDKYYKIKLSYKYDPEVVEEETTDEEDIPF